MRYCMMLWCWSCWLFLGLWVRIWSARCWMWDRSKHTQYDVVALICTYSMNNRKRKLSEYLPSDLPEFPRMHLHSEVFKGYSHASEVSGMFPHFWGFQKSSCTSKVSESSHTSGTSETLFILSEVAYLAITYCWSLQAYLCPSYKLSFFFSFLSHSCTLLGSSWGEFQLLLILLCI